jgi:predicted transcriptional regulator/transcriptional regulator with XRE-family HTH domain
MSTKIYAGERIRRLREVRGISQAALAAAVGLSTSYLNQIENNQRPLSAAAVIRLSSYFSVEPSHFADDADMRLASEMREALGDPLFAEQEVKFAGIRDAVRAAPEIMGAFLKLYRAYRSLEEEQQALVDRVGGEETVNGPAFPYDEVRDFVQSRRNHFEGLDHAAEDLFETSGFSKDRLLEHLAQFLADRHGVTIRVAQGFARHDVLWRYEPEERILFVSETAPRESRTFYAAHQIGLLSYGVEIERLVAEANLSSVEARSIARVGLANYFAGALILPYRRFLTEAQRMRYDIDRLSAYFGVSFEQVCHRLSTMQRPGMPGVPFYFMKVDMAGNIAKRSSATRFQFARFGGACPLWNVHQAFAQPGRILVQQARMPDGATYLCIARTVVAGGSGYLSRPREAAVGLGCEISFADQLVYSAGLDLKDADAAVPIGSNCKVCDREDCRHRAFPPIGKALRVDAHERRTVPYNVT